MRLLFAEIFDFKSIKHEFINISTNQLCFVGINESGKSSFIEALSYLNVFKELSPQLLNKSSRSYPSGMPLISGVFEIEKNDQNLHKLFKDYVKENNQPVHEPLFLQFKRWGNGFNNISLLLSDHKSINQDLIKSLIEPNKKTEFLDLFFNNCFPIIEIFKNEDLLLEPATLDDLLGTNSKFETFRRLLFIGGCKNIEILNLGDPNSFATYIVRIEQTLNKILRKHYKQDETIILRIITTTSGHLNVVIQDGTEQSFTIHERSPGFQYYFAFLINKLYFNEFHDSRRIIYLLDEPGVNLHPKGAKDLLKTFEEVSTKSLIFFTTHNPFLAIRNDIESLIFVHKTSKDGTKLNRKPWINKYQILRRELGIVLNDSFLIGEFNLIVEGVTEKLALHEIFQLEKYRGLEWLNIYNADGVNNIAQTLNYLGKNNLNQSGVALLDSDSEGLAETRKAGFIKSMNESNWKWIQINDVFNNKDQARTFEDLFPQDLYIQAFNEYCQSIQDLGVFDQPYKNYQKSSKKVDTPIVNALKEHFNGFINADRRKENSISKQNVIIKLFDLISKLPSSEQNAALESILKLADLIELKVKQIEKHVSHQA